MDSTAVAPQSVAEAREQICSLEQFMLKFPEEDQYELPLKHFIGHGLYIRECFIPAGMLVVSKIHKVAHWSTLISGTARVVTDQGLQEITGPITFESPVAVKNVVLAITDVVWATYHVTNETDLAKIEEDVIAKTYDDIAIPYDCLTAIGGVQ
jgi:hypothetical protein